MQRKKVREDPGGRQSDLAEGELETVEESIRIHEKKEGHQGKTPGEHKEEKKSAA